MHHISDNIEHKMESTSKNIFLGQYVKFLGLLYDKETTYFLTMGKSVIAHNWKRESPPSIKQWYTKLWSYYVKAKLTDSLQTIQKETDNSDFTVVWYPLLIYMAVIRHTGHSGLFTFVAL